MARVSTPPTPGSFSKSSAFPAKASDVLRRLRRAVAEMFDCVPGGIQKSRDVQKLFGVNTKLSWQIFKLAGPDDPLSLAPHVPKDGAMRKVLEGAEKYGVPARLINEVRVAYSEFEELIKLHAGDRTSFESMASGLSDGNRSRQIDVSHRKAIFRGHAHFWGAQVETRAVTHFIHPTENQGRYDLVAVRTKFGLRRLRSDADVLVDRIRMYPPSGTEAHHWDYLDEEVAKRYGAPVISSACTQPLPQLRTCPGQHQDIYFELTDDALGLSGAVNLSFGQVLANTVLSPNDDGKRLGWLVVSHTLTPAALLIADMLVHRESMPRLDIELNLHGHANRESPYEVERTFPRLPCREQITKLESGVDGARIHGTPEYMEMLKYVCARRGWHLDDFDVYRLRVEYPLMDTMLAMRFDLPVPS